MPDTNIESNSILISIKKALGLAEDYTVFDPEIIMHINSVLADLFQLGVGPEDGLFIASASDTWDELIGIDRRLNAVKSYVFLRVKFLFDPPTVGYVLTSLEKLIEKAEWRITVAQDEILHPAPQPQPVVVYIDPFDPFE